MHNTARPLRPIDWVVILCVLLGAAVLRTTGLDFGRPNPAHNRSLQPMINMNTTLHPDEYFYVSIPYEMVARGWAYPHFYENPSFLINLNRITFQLTNSATEANPGRWDAEKINNRSFAPFPLYVIGRFYSMLGGLLIVASLYATTRLMMGRYAALFVGLLAAVSLPLVQHAHYATTSSLAGAGVAVCLWGCYAALCQPRRATPLIIAGIAAGIAAGNRYNAAAVAISLTITGVLLLLISGRWRTFLIVALSGAAFPITFLITTPGFLGENEFFWEQFRFIYARYGTVGGYTGLFHEYRYMVLLGIGLPAAVLAVIGFVEAWRRFRFPLFRHIAPIHLYPSLILGAFALPYSLVVLNTPFYPNGDQLTVPFIPVLCLWAGLGFALVQRLIRARGMAVVAVIAIGTALLPTLLFVARLNQPDTREELEAWIYEHIPHGSRIHLAGGYNIALDPADYVVTQDYDYTTPLRTLMAQQVDYVVVSDAAAFSHARVGEKNDSDTWDDPQLPLIAEIPRWHSWLDWLPVNNAVYWHQPGLRVYCLPHTGHTCGE